ncbi:MAG TPA: helix-hairpin-helix domain-containing protein, partial [Cytophagales bacterium]|nr:helix-hairpin-helix domain-containing protein [Cytophagales bacterium]
YKLNYEDILKLEGYKEKSAQNVIEGIAKSKEMPFKKVLFALGIRFVGETVAEKLVDSLHSVDKLMTATYEELMAVPEIGERIAQSVLEYFKNGENLKIIEALRAAGLQFVSEPTEARIVTDKLGGATFVISGVFEKYERDQLKDIILANGGKVSSSVSAKLNYLLAGAGMGPSKLQKAQELGIKIISEQDFEHMLA